MIKLTLIFATISGMLSVGLGAFGAHVLKEKLEVSRLLLTYQTAVQYQFYHTLVLLAIGLLMTKYSSHWLSYSSYAMMIGIIVFSGSLYVLSLSGVKWLGAITPLGGLAFILGWGCLLMACLKIEF
ncbi:MAG: DUF423 domain-containing protein [Cytophagales bacterium]|nr:DUF423 domain-containing protein [Cytophagales bacterium]